MTAPAAIPALPRAEPVVWQPSFRIIAGRFPAVPYLEVATSAEDAAHNLDLARLTDGAAAGMLDAYRLLPNEDRLSGPGSGLLMPSFLFPARPGRFSTGTRGGTYYAAGDEATARAETMYHFAMEVEGAPAALAAALAVGTPPRRAMQTIAVDVLGVFLDVRGGGADPDWGDLYHTSNYAPGQRLEAAARALPADGVVYDSVRRRPAHGECLAVHRPRALRNGRVTSRLTYAWTGPGQVAIA